VGTGARVQRVLQKAMTGAPVTISVLGGSSESSFHPLPVSLRAKPSAFSERAQAPAPSAETVLIRSLGVHGRR
jgi:hypothetical protein